jgi:hypothetical protein
MTDIPPSWSREEIARAWGISPKEIDRLVRAGKVGYYKAGRSRRFFAEHLTQIREALEHTATPPPATGLIGLSAKSAARRRSA